MIPAVARLLTDHRIVRGSRLVIGAVFVVAALAKLGDLEAFALQIHNFRLVPLGLENLMAMALPWIELLAGLALLFNHRARGGGLVITGLLVAFTVAVVVAMARGLDIECGCFGTADGTRVGLVKVLENSGMLLLGLLASLRPR